MSVRATLRGLIFSLFILVLAGSQLTQAATSCKSQMEFITASAALKVPGKNAAMSADLQKSSDRFRAYFEAIRKNIHERDFIMNAAELALLSEEGLLMMGPPGNAKSMVAKEILGNIVEEKKAADGKITKTPSYFSIQMTPETTLSETHGPLDYKKLTETNKYERIYEEGMLLSRNVFIDEIFDARANASRNILGLLAERTHKQGPREVKGIIETVFAATNKYIGEVYEKAGDDGPKALLDRFSFTVFIPGEFENSDSYINLIKSAKKNRAAAPDLTFDDLERIRAEVQNVEIPDHVAKFLSVLSFKMKVETEALEQSALKSYKEKLRNGEEALPPYRATKYHSPRTLYKAAGILKALVVRDWINKGGKRPLEATLEDVKNLESFFTLGGPSDSFVSDSLERSTNPHERSQLAAILREREIFRSNYDAILTDVNQVAFRHAVADLQTQIDSHPSTAEIEEIAKKLTNIVLELSGTMTSNPRQADLTGEEIGKDLVIQYARESLKELLGDKYEETVGRIEKQINDERRQRIEEEQKAAEAAKAEERRIIAEKRRLEAERVRKEQEAKERVNKVADTYKNMAGYELKPVNATPGGKPLLGLGANNELLVRDYYKNIDIYSPTEGVRRLSSTTGSREYRSVVGSSDINEMTLTKDGDLLVISDDKVFVFDSKTQELKNDFRIPQYHSNSVYLHGENKLLVFDRQLLRFSLYDMTTGAKSIFRINDRITTKSSVQQSEILEIFKDASRLVLTPDKKGFVLLNGNYGKALHVNLDTKQATYTEHPSINSLIYNSISADGTKVFLTATGGSNTYIGTINLVDPSKSEQVSLNHGNLGLTSVTQAVVVEDGSLALLLTDKGVVLYDLINKQLVDGGVVTTTRADSLEIPNGDYAVAVMRGQNLTLHVYYRKKK